MHALAILQTGSPAATFSMGTRNDGFPGYPRSLNSSPKASKERGSSSRNCLRIYDRHLDLVVSDY